MENEETRWIAALEKFLGFVRSEAPFAVQGVETFLRTIEGLLADPKAAPPRKYEEARRLESIFGGMGSVNDFPWSREGMQAKEVLYEALQDVLRVYWRDLGHESHDATQFRLLAIGTEVRLIPGKTAFIGRDGKPTGVKPREAKATWTVEAHHPPDVSGMPMYLLKSSNHYHLVRHEALAPT